jgi:hypothetical protein
MNPGVTPTLNHTLNDLSAVTVCVSAHGYHPQGNVTRVDARPRHLSKGLERCAIKFRRRNNAHSDSQAIGGAISRNPRWLCGLNDMRNGGRLKKATIIAMAPKLMLAR